MKIGQVLRLLVPDGKIILSPAESDLEVVVFCDKLTDLVVSIERKSNEGCILTVSLENLALGLSHTVDMSSGELMTNSKETLPASHWVGTDNGASLSVFACRAS